MSQPSLINLIQIKFSAFKDLSQSTRKVFVIGTGRSGTHLLGNILNSHPMIQATIEKPKVFNLVTSMALDMNKRKRLLPRLIRNYRIEHAMAAPKHYVDKSHPNIWVAEELAKKFPNAKFIGIQRNPYGVIASMLKHQGVLHWHKNWTDYPVPNDFLGINQSNVSSYEKMSLEEQCALRWCSHTEKMLELKSILDAQLLVLKYEKLVKNPIPYLENMVKFLGLQSSFPLPKMKTNSLDKWKDQLSQAQIKNIDGIINKYFKKVRKGETM